MKRPGFRTSRPSGSNDFPSRDRQNFSRALSGGSTPQQTGRTEDSLTTAPFSQVQILHLMKSEFARARRHDYPLACLVIGLDQGMAIAEAQRSEFRSQLRSVLAESVAGQTREHDHLGILKDDRFLMVLAYTELEPARHVAERILATFDEGIEVGGRNWPVRLSIGVSSAQGAETLFFDTLVSQAEIALEWAQRDGGDLVRVFRRDRFVELDAPSESAPNDSAD